MKVFGIRHHGPGSAKRLSKALREYQPDCLLIELPAGVEKALKYLGEPELKPPVALLMYPVKDFQSGSFLPFAEFSPEWQAMKYALKKDIPIIPMDLQMGIQVEQQAGTKMSGLRTDPLGHLARLAGFKDSERWWDVTFEQEDNDLAVFEMIEEMTMALREGALFDEQPLNIAREAHMRKVLRKAIKDGYQKIAVVCGAWHMPALTQWQSISAKSDNDRLRGLKKEKYEVSWIPWNYERLSFYSGYGAGVVSPAWYELLFRYKTSISIRWMAKAGRLLRQKGQDGSPAHVLEAIRLADTLTALRNKPLPGLSELEDAAITVFCRGDRKLFELIRKRVVIGQKSGKVPEKLTRVPLQKDFEKKVKSARLSPALKSAEAVTKEFDLRKPTQLLASKLLHSLMVLEVPWGKPMKGSQYKTGSFSEKWKLKWVPDYYVKIVQAAIYGNTIEEAALNKMKEKLDKAKNLQELTMLMDQSIKADIPDVIPELTQKMQELAALTKDILTLMEALPALVQVYQYGNQRKSETQFFKDIIEEIVPRIFIGLPAVCSGIEEELAREVYAAMMRSHHALHLFNQRELLDSWLRVLKTLSHTKSAHLLIQGWCWRMLFDKQQVETERMETIMQGYLTTSREPMDFAQWLDGFLSGSGLLLIHNPGFWKLLDDWIQQLSEEQFKTILPILRRTFSAFQGPERKKMLDLARFGPDTAKKVEIVDVNEELAEMALSSVRKLLEI
jgi:hypothetical protein